MAGLGPGEHGGDQQSRMTDSRLIFGLSAVAHRHSSEVWLEGVLERGVVPDSCVWTAGDGAGEDGFLILLEKMNLELLRRCVGSTHNGVIPRLPCSASKYRCSVSMINM